MSYPLTAAGLPTFAPVGNPFAAPVPRFAHIALPAPLDADGLGHGTDPAETAEAARCGCCAALGELTPIGSYLGRDWRDDSLDAWQFSAWWLALDLMSGLIVAVCEDCSNLIESESSEEIRP